MYIYIFILIFYLIFFKRVELVFHKKETGTCPFPAQAWASTNCPNGTIRAEAFNGDEEEIAVPISAQPCRTAPPLPGNYPWEMTCFPPAAAQVSLEQESGELQPVLLLLPLLLFASNSSNFLPWRKTQGAALLLPRSSHQEILAIYFY